MKKAALISALAFATAFSLPALAARKTVVLSVPTMNCPACPITVRAALEKVPGVEKVKATLEPPEALVTFDDAKTGTAQLMRATRDAGYPSSVRQGK
ncbi:MAG TPA: mercury resistance system periplasmic binding protein MerP [Burkholderiales bacterium]|nr:mercury resistance system periplasmic binding protein MerP [Burkholderiales bacterium]